MFDPVSIFYFMLMFGSAELPSGRLSVKDVVEIRENSVIVEHISSEIKLRNGL